MLTQLQLNQLNIEEVLEHYGLDYRITSRGNANFNCPFHGESNPSCGMHVDTGMWKCFACGEQGNILTFVAKMESISNSEAEEKIKKRWLQRVPDIGTLADEINNILSKQQETLSEDPRFPLWLLSQYPKEWHYMYSRGFTDNTLEHFNILYDPQTKRQVIPYYDSQGALIGATGRATQGEEPRYYPIIRCKKGNYVYNYHRIDRTKQVIAVEGEINCMKLWQVGYTNVIAFSGSGISRPQLQIMKNSEIPELLVFFDTDLAGKHGTQVLFTNLWPYMKIKTVADHEGDPATMDENTIKQLIEHPEVFELVI